MRRPYWFALSFLLIFTLALPVQAQPSASSKLAPSVQRVAAGLPANGRLAVIVRLIDPLNPASVPAQPGQGKNRAQALSAALQSHAARAQAPLLADLKAAQDRGEAGRVLPLWITNAVLVEATPALLAALVRRADVAGIALDSDPANPIVPVGSFSRRKDASLSAGAPEPNLTQIGAPDLWALGYRGQGVTVAIVDSGVDGAQPDLAGRYRGGAHDWYDPYGEFAAPTDSAGVWSGHGTGVAGAAVGDGTGNGTDSRSTGVAPGAKWIAAKIFNSYGAADLASVHLALQWALDPDGDPNTADAPQVVNNSWDFSNTNGCNSEFQPDITRLRSAGISVVFAAGNVTSGSFLPNTSVSPANNLGVISVGAVDSTSAIASFSGQGANACSAARVFPSLVAPGVSLYTTGLNSSYVVENGTSFSAPEVSGGLALLLSFFPGFTPDQLEAALESSAADLGAVGADSVYGYGLVNLPAARSALAGQLKVVFFPIIGSK